MYYVCTIMYTTGTPTFVFEYSENKHTEEVLKKIKSKYCFHDSEKASILWMQPNSSDKKWIIDIRKIRTSKESSDDKPSLDL